MHNFDLEVDCCPPDFLNKVWAFALLKKKKIISLLQDAIGVNEELQKKSDEELAKTLNINDGELADRLLKIDGELADRLQKSLKGRRYLIVVDDI